MRQVVQVTEVDGEGLESLMGKRVLLMCAGYFYEGKLIGVNSTFVKLEDPAVVYEIGLWDKKEYADIQKLHTKFWYVQTGLIESFGESKIG